MEESEEIEEFIGERTNRFTDGSVDAVNQMIMEMMIKGWFYWSSYWPPARNHLVMVFWRQKPEPKE